MAAASDKCSTRSHARDGRSVNSALPARFFRIGKTSRAMTRGICFLGDIGNNDARRPSLAVHQIDEPDLEQSKNGLARVTRSWTLRFPKAPFDCESLVVWGDSGYVISKVFEDARAELFRFSLTNSVQPQTLQLVGELKIDSPVTGADISADGKLLGIVAKHGAYVYRVDGDLARATKGKPYQTKFSHEHIEACTFVPEGLLATAESREIYLSRMKPSISGRRRRSDRVCRAKPRSTRRAAGTKAENFAHFASSRDSSLPLFADDCSLDS